MTLKKGGIEKYMNVSRKPYPSGMPDNLTGASSELEAGAKKKSKTLQYRTFPK